MLSRFAPKTDAQPLVLLNARLIDPATETDIRGGLLIRAGVIADLGPGVTVDNAPNRARIIDCRGDVVCPGLIDMQAFVGEPGAEHRETIATATAAAAAGGVTTILATPATSPVVDDPAVVDFVLRRARDTGKVRVLPMAALTKGCEGREIAELGLLGQAGAVAFSDGAHAVANALVMRRALSYARDFDALVVHFPQDRDLAGEGVMNEGETSLRLGLAGVPAEAETIVLDRDLRLAALTGGRYHASIIAAPLSLEAISEAKVSGHDVTCGTSINHLTLNENDIGDYRTFLKLRPPLRSEPDRRALVHALAEGLVDVIVSDHDPQDVETKRLPFGAAEFGAIGLETMLAAGLRLVHSGDVPLTRLLAAMTCNPAKILKLEQGRLQKGAPADVIRFDPDEPFVVDPLKLRSRCRNTPFAGALLQGVVKMTIVGGEIVWEVAA
ncbi:dihydroorotase [Methylocystis heyeri]|uniref:Amidohydrolase family protein n=1 Tax=Methylocystis heyeri TaxID=391905 RepID=A0A6B8KCP8_9HYPH|nr:dihydroorotase [Methylocystis heyeri]QGM45382.1 amidohydrolase family protein [Methylocystis heyeri]